MSADALTDAEPRAAAILPVSAGRLLSLDAYRGLIMFILVSNGLGISALALFLSHYGLGFTTILADNVATIIGIGLGTLFRFWAYRRYVFRVATA